MRTSFIKTSILGLSVAASSLFAEATYTPHKYQQNDWFAEFGGNNDCCWIIILILLICCCCGGNNGCGC